MEYSGGGHAFARQTTLRLVHTHPPSRRLTTSCAHPLTTTFNKSVRALGAERQ